MVAPLITQAQLENRIGGPARLVQLTDLDGDGVADSTIVSDILLEATQLAIGLLWNGFPTFDTVARLVASDTSVTGAICDIACGLAGQIRSEFYAPDGSPIYEARRVRGEKVLKDAAQAARRLAGEETVGRNGLLRARVSRNIVDNPFVFPRSSKDRKGPGGF